jgi:thiamine-phosphate pyrophosphorylase
VTLPRSEVPALYAITDASRGTHASLAAALSSAGVRWIQIREKEMADRALYEEIRRAMGLVAKDVTVFVNDRADLAIAGGAHGVHLGDEDLSPALARKAAAGRPLRIGYSTHSVEEAEAAAADPAVDYIAVGPIFRSSTKDVREPRGLELIRAVRALTDKPLVAIGGIARDNIARVILAGADSAAVISALYAPGAMQENVAALIEEAESAR